MTRAPEDGYVRRHERMDDYVGAGVFATIKWDRSCPKDRSGWHLLGLLTHSCAKCGDRPTIKYERATRASSELLDAARKEK